MHLLPVVAAFAVMVGALAAMATTMLAAPARRAVPARGAVAAAAAAGTGPVDQLHRPADAPGRAADQPARRWLALGSTLAGLGAVTGLIGVVTLSADWVGHQPERMRLANLVAVGLALGGLALCAGTLRLPMVARGSATAGRLILDGLVIAASLWFVGWVLLTGPTRLLGSATPVGCPAILLATVTSMCALGLAGIVAIRAMRPRRRPLLVTGGLSAVAVGGLLLAAGVCQSGPAATLTGAGLVAAGPLLIALSARMGSSCGATDTDVMRRGAAYAFVPMLAMAVSAVYHLLRGGDFTWPGIIGGIVEGFALVARQSLALREVRGYANRLIEREAHFRELAHTDPLTGLANRRGLLRALHEETSGARGVLLGLDLDGFKNVNDMRGHDVGDAVLVEVGQRLRRNLRPGDLAARLGGDEFAVLMWAGGAEAQQIAERLLEVLNRPYDQPDAPVFLSVSIGLATPPDSADVEDLVRNADLALRYAKQRGKNRIERYDVAYDRLLRRRTMLEHELRGAIDRDELRLAFQPVVSVPSVRPVGAEALLRWTHPVLGSVGPDEFIPLAEECGMIATLGAWVLHQACRQLSRWLAEGHDVWVSVNVSPRELHAPEYVLQVAEALRAHRVPPQRLVLEVTEHAVATDLDELIRRLAALRLTGVRIALDDFGAGYSSLGQLRRLPIDILKIDHSLVTEHEPTGPANRSGPVVAPMVDVVMRLGHQLGLEVIAEGVTTPTELAGVVAAGCRFGQGALFGWGVPAEHLEAQLEAATAAGARSEGLPPVPVRRPAVAPLPTAASASWSAPTQRASDEAMAPSVQDVRSVDSAREMRQA